MVLGLRRPDILVALDNDVLNNWRTNNATIVSAIDNYVAITKTPPALTSITVFELMHGFENAIVQNGMNERLEQDIHHARDLTRECAILPFNQEAAEIAAYIFPRLTRKEKKDHWADALIVATVIAHEYGIATLNRIDFEMLATHVPPQYPRLRIEVWK
jgi:predicted nucleic acid-binding protein